MPKKPKKPCKFQGCPDLTDGLYCERHAQTENRRYNKYQRNPAINKRYGAEWKRIRKRYIAGHPLCEECQKRNRYTPATEVHHIKPLSEFGTHDERNLMSLCHACHSRITMEANNRRS